MKKFSIFIILITNIAFSQNKETKFNLSFKTGITFANMYGKDVSNETFLNGDSPETFYANSPASSHLKNGNNFGLLLNYKFSKHLSLGLGVSYIQKGTRINATSNWNSTSSSFDNVSGKINWIQNYWTFDIPLTFYIPLKKDDFYFESGWFFANLNNSKEKGNIKILNTEYKYVNNRRANKNESGYFLGIGYLKSLKKSTNKILFELKWSRSVSKSLGADMIPFPQIYHNQTYSINIGYVFKLKKKK
jgi:outer membrane protein with beta-barrel domain